MRNSFFPAMIALLLFFTSCNDAEKTSALSATAQKNLDAFYAVDSAFQTGDISRIDQVVSSDFVDHTPNGDMKGTDSLKAMITMMKNAGTMKSEIKKVLADDEYVMGWLRWTGTSDGSMGMPAGPFDMSGVEVVRFKDGKAVEHWAFMDVVDAMKMMPAGQQNPPATNPASTDKPR